MLRKKHVTRPVTAITGEGSWCLFSTKIKNLWLPAQKGGRVLVFVNHRKTFGAALPPRPERRGFRAEDLMKLSELGYCLVLGGMGMSMNADHNAALNILMAGYRQADEKCRHARGGGKAQAPPVKQEPSRKAAA
jgi:hypothetical protein